jgi:hypothetical protein
LVLDRFDHLTTYLLQVLGDGQGPKLSDEVTHSLAVTLKRRPLPPIRLKPCEHLNALDDGQIDKTEEAFQVSGFFQVHLG